MSLPADSEETEVKSPAGGTGETPQVGTDELPGDPSHTTGEIQSSGDQVVGEPEQKRPDAWRHDGAGATSSMPTRQGGRSRRPGRRSPRTCTCCHGAGRCPPASTAST